MNFLGLGPGELIIILLIILVLFGVGRISKIAGEMGSGIRAFKNGLKGPEEEARKEAEKEKLTGEAGKPPEQ